YSCINNNNKIFKMQTSEEISVKKKWTIDPLHIEIGFKVRHLMFTNVIGKFREYDTSVYVINDDFTTAEIHVWINPASINTNNDQRDAHLKSVDFFDVENFKEIDFAGNAFKHIKDDNYELHGELSMKTVKKQIKLNVQMAGIVKDPLGTEKALFSIHGKINRKDWGLNWNAPLET